MAATSKPENTRVRKSLTQERLKELLHYDPETGIWTWRVAATHFVEVGQVAGYVNPDGYRTIHIDGTGFRSSHLAVLFMTGSFPETGVEVDHRDCNPSNDRWINLREATSAENKWNTRVSKNSRSGLKGAFWHKQMQKWRSQIMRHGVLHNLGMFDTAEEAHAAYCEAAKSLHGKFARTS